MRTPRLTLHAVVPMLVAVIIGCAPLLGIDEPELVELGAICTGSNGGQVELCPASVQACATFDGTVDWCTTPCGTTPPASGSNSPQPPAEGDQICRAFASPGTAVCGYPDAVTDPTRVTWYCEILCGTYQGQLLGSCPPGLTCRANLCQ